LGVLPKIQEYPERLRLFYEGFYYDRFR
jgi:hypothetical protein